MSRRETVIRWLMILVVLIAFGARFWQLGSVPPGLSDDELSDILVIAQKVLNGDYSLYYTDATGLEAPYHILSAVPLVLFGYNAIGIRLLSAMLGTLTVPLTYVMARRLFGNRWLALVSAAALAVSFWSLLYSRVNIRHISMPVLMLLTFICFWRIVRAEDVVVRRRYAVFSGLFMGAGLYTYFAARGVPLIILAFCLYLALFHRSHFRARWRQLLLPVVIAMLVALPLAVELLQQGGVDARVSEVAVPLREAAAGDFSRLEQHIIVTLSMFHADGDDEFLYNIPHRPVFGLLLGSVFWLGVGTAFVLALGPFVPVYRTRFGTFARRYQLAATFLLLWWAAGIVPGFLSVPAASLGHTIAAQPASYILLGLPLLVVQRWPRGLPAPMRTAVVFGLGLALFILVAQRDLPDYFVRWPAQGNTRFLYHADLINVSRYLAENPHLTEFGITGLLAGPWDRMALEIAAGNDPLAVAAGAPGLGARWYDPRRAIFLATADAPATVFMGYPVVEPVYPAYYEEQPGETAGGYRLATVANAFPQAAEPVCFENGLCWAGYQYDPQSGALDLVWQVGDRLDLPEQPLVSKPPPPNVYDGLRLYVFAHLVDREGQLLNGDDGLWVNPATLEAGDWFMQRHWLPVPEGTAPAALLTGLYDPLTGTRILTDAGADAVRLPLPVPEGG